MKQLIIQIVQALVDKPDEVQIKEVIGDHAHVLELRVAKEELQKLWKIRLDLEEVIATNRANVINFCPSA